MAVEMAEIVSTSDSVVLYETVRYQCILLYLGKLLMAIDQLYYVDDEDPVQRAAAKARIVDRLNRITKTVAYQGHFLFFFSNFKIKSLN